MTYSNILLIDDDSDDQEIFMEAIQKIKKTVICTAFLSAVDALHQLASKAIHPDLIFLDLNMPVMSGQQFLAKIKADRELQKIPVIIFSTSSNKETIDETKEMGAIDFITKPNSFADLINILEAVLH